MTLEDAARTVTDGAIALGAVTSPWWVNLIDKSLHWATAVGGLVLVGLQVAAHLDKRRRK